MASPKQLEHTNHLCATKGKKKLKKNFARKYKNILNILPCGTVREYLLLNFLTKMNTKLNL